MIKVNKKVMIHEYKRNGWLHRVWEFPKIIVANDNFVCAYLKGSRTIMEKEKDNSKNKMQIFHSKPLSKESFWFFFPDKWFSIMTTLNPNEKVDYKINISSPYFYEEEAIKFYDFDLDIRIRNSNPKTFKVEDRDEYDENTHSFAYEKEVQDQCEKTLEFFKNEDVINRLMKCLSPDVIKSLLKRT